jgi:hypothetical protein
VFTSESVGAAKYDEFCYIVDIDKATKMKKRISQNPTHGERMNAQGTFFFKDAYWKTREPAIDLTQKLKSYLYKGTYQELTEAPAINSN